MVIFPSSLGGPNLFLRHLGEKVGEPQHNVTLLPLLLLPILQEKSSLM